MSQQWPEGLSYIKKQMQDKNLFKDYTMLSLIDKLDLIEGFEHPSHDLWIGEMNEEQKKIYIDMGINPPA